MQLIAAKITRPHKRPSELRGGNASRENLTSTSASALARLNFWFGGALTTADQWKQSPGGYFGGIQADYAWQASNFVYGLEADFQGGSLRDSACVALCSGSVITEIVDQKIKWFGTARGRLGYATGPALFYLTGGLAYGTVKTSKRQDSRCRRPGPAAHQ